MSVRVLQELIAERKIVDAVARTKNGHVLSAPRSCAELVAGRIVPGRDVRRQLDRVEKAMKHLEAEVEAVRFDLNEALADPDGPLGDDLIVAGEYGRDNRKTLAGALSTLNSEVMALTVVKRRLAEVRRTV